MSTAQFNISYGAVLQSEDIFCEQLEIKYGRLRAIVSPMMVVGAVSLQMVLPMAPIYCIQTCRSILRTHYRLSEDNGFPPTWLYKTIFDVNLEDYFR